MGLRDENMRLQDIGEHDYKYVIAPYNGDKAKIIQYAEELNTAFPVVSETYHDGPLPLSSSGMCLPHAVTVSAVKPAEDGRGIIVRLTETLGTIANCTAKLLGATISCKLTPDCIRSFRIFEGKVTECDFREIDI